MSSSSSPTSSQVGAGEGHGGGGSGGRRRRRRGGRQTYEGESSASSIRRRSSNIDGVWPEPFVEALAVQVAADAALSVGRLAAAPSIATLFQVCSTWRAVSRSELLWQNLTRRIWNCSQLLRHSWREEYIYRHRTAQNFRLRRYVHTVLQFDDQGPEDNGVGDNLLCLRLTLSDHHLAAGFSDGSVRLFNLHSLLLLHTYRPFPRDLLGVFSRAVSGIILTLPQLIFASLDGDIHVSLFDNGGPGPTRRALLGNVVNDGALVDFTGCNRFWVGLYAGVPGRAIHIWDGESEELLFVGETLTDPEAVIGWHTLTALTEFVGRVRIMNQELAVACTSLRVLVFDLRDMEVIHSQVENRRGLIVGCLDTSNDEYLTADSRGVVTVRRGRTSEQVYAFRVRGAAVARGVIGCMNSCHAIIFAGGVIRLWEIEGGEYLYRLRERVEATVLAANDRHLAASSNDRTIHLWDFGA
ncbi:hypothetical protein Nepgr_014408 [Nepenthes gracilis]|uniref:Transcriptional regulator STERILE APETALA n=1 Tax=Nepenthes gracilis TaxID=150966 RepID=A0AAD3XPG7_NEPGR|nr:hypothetical protein Nepgr_014408 [Nepenthes gracilis]